MVSSVGFQSSWLLHQMTQLVSSCSHFVVSVAILQKNLAGWEVFFFFLKFICCHGCWLGFGLRGLVKWVKLGWLRPFRICHLGWFRNCSSKGWEVLLTVYVNDSIILITRFFPKEEFIMRYEFLFFLLQTYWLLLSRFQLGFAFGCCAVTFKTSVFFEISKQIVWDLVLVL